MRTKEKITKPRFIPKRKPPILSDFTLSLTDILSVTEDAYIEYRAGFGLVLRVPGTDIFNYKQNDKEISYGAYGLSLIGTTNSIKIISLDTAPDYEHQIEFYKSRAVKQSNAYRKYIIERQAEHMQYYQNHDRERSYYVIAYGKTKEAALENAASFNSMISAKTAVKMLDKKEVVQMLQYLHVKV